MKRDKKGKITSESDDKGFKFTVTFPSIKNLFLGQLSKFLYHPWAIILESSNILQKLLEFFENILLKKEESETSKKKGLFY